MTEKEINEILDMIWDRVNTPTKIALLPFVDRLVKEIRRMKIKEICDNCEWGDGTCGDHEIDKDNCGRLKFFYV